MLHTFRLCLFMQTQDADGVTRCAMLGHLEVYMTFFATNL